MTQKHEAHPPHNQQEYIVAGIVYLGMGLAILSGMLAAFNMVEGDLLGLSLTNYFWIGAILMVIGTVLWLTMLQPWKNFDDLKEPYFTGHHGPHAPVDLRGTGTLTELSITDTAGPEPDDLEIIEGVGEKGKAALVDAGITTFRELAKTSTEDLQRILQRAGIKTNPATWAKQAQYVVDGDVEGFEGYKASIRGGAEALERIEGIGPKAKKALVDAGITTFKQLSETPLERLEEIVQNAGLKLLKPDTWARQAKFIVDGDVAGFETYKAKLVAGVEPEEKH
jgi:predicted flap endonuclease-1-like 5' DNA nuclease